MRNEVRALTLAVGGPLPADALESRELAVLDAQDAHGGDVAEVPVQDARNLLGGRHVHEAVLVVVLAQEELVRRGDRLGEVEPVTSVSARSLLTSDRVTRKRGT